MTEAIRSNMLPVSLSVEARGWLDLKRGPENLRRSMERVFGLPTGRLELTGRDGLELLHGRHPPTPLSASR
ncbi:MAG: hypothetical protein LUC18_02090 [Porphyromonadaceae bacterium]|nr:hypothetical protein [Porphyromonadaceae bacterium]